MIQCCIEKAGNEVLIPKKGVGTFLISIPA